MQPAFRVVATSSSLWRFRWSHWPCDVAENTEFMPSLTGRPCTADIKCVVKCASSRFIIAFSLVRSRECTRAPTSNKILARIPFRRRCVHMEKYILHRSKSYLFQVFHEFIYPHIYHKCVTSIEFIRDTFRHLPRVASRILKINIKL